MAESLDGGTVRDPRVSHTEGERKAAVRKSILPFLYGLAGANFITLIQFASTAQIHALSGLLGMILMAVGVPALIGCAVCADIIVRSKPLARELSPVLFAIIISVGVGGIALTLTAFQWWVGTAFMGGVLIAAWWIATLAKKAARAGARPE